MNLLALALLAGVLASPAGSAPTSPADQAKAPVVAPAWRVIKSAHFVIRSDAPAATVQAVVDRLEDVHEALRTTFFTDLPVRPVDVLLFANEPDFRSVARPGLVGFYTAGLEEPAGFSDGLIVLHAGGSPTETVSTTAAHELAHHFLQTLSDRVPLWLHEGFAKYVGALEVRGDRVVFDATAPSGAWLQAARPVALERLLAAGPEEFNGPHARAHYLTSWLLLGRLLAPRGMGAAGLQELVVASVRAQSPASHRRSLFSTTERRELQRQIAAAYQTHRAALPSGPTSRDRDKLIVRLQRSQPRQLQVDTLSRSEVDTLCAALRAAAPEQASER